MINMLMEMLSYPFLRRAILVGLLISISASLLGIILIAKRYAGIGNSLSHVGFGTMAIAKALGVDSLMFSLPVLVTVAYFLLRLKENSKLKGDQLLGLLSAVFLALGVMTISHSTGRNTDVCNYMFGSILAMNISDVRVSIALSLFIITLFIIYYNEIFAITFDEEFAVVLGLNIQVFKFVASAMTAVVIILGMKMMGALLISSLILFPGISANRIFHSFKSVAIVSVSISVVGFILGIILSYRFSFPTGASIVMVNSAVFLVFYLVGKVLDKGKIK